MSRNHRGKRNEKSQNRRTQEYLARSYAFQYAYHDQIIKELACTTTKDEIMKYIQEVCVGEPLQFFPDDNMDGMVLANQLTYQFYLNSLPPVPLQVNKYGEAFKK